jgi:hypothetical protein
MLHYAPQAADISSAGRRDAAYTTSLAQFGCELSTKFVASLRVENNQDGTRKSRTSACIRCARPSVFPINIEYRRASTGNI